MLPPALERVRDGELKETLAAHLEQTRAHATRVESAFRHAGAEPAAARSAGLAGLQAQHESQEVKEPTLADVLEAAAAARVEHLELALYDVVLGLARELGHDECAALLADNRTDEEHALERVTRIASRLRSELPR